MEEQTIKHILLITLVLGALVNAACVPMPPADGYSATGHAQPGIQVLRGPGR
jgi:hypothetical protein